MSKEEPIIDRHDGVITIMLAKGERFLDRKYIGAQRDGVIRYDLTSDRDAPFPCFTTEDKVNVNALSDTIMAEITKDEFQGAEQVRAMFLDGYPAPRFVYTFTLKDRKGPCPRIARRDFEHGGIIW